MNKSKNGGAKLDSYLFFNFNLFKTKQEVVNIEISINYYEKPYTC